MCGLLGALSLAPQAVEPLRALAAGLAHRGPDDAGCATWTPGEPPTLAAPYPPHAQVVLAHRRLAILDLSPRGHQPMASPCGRYVLVFNGEVYNYRELRVELEALGHRFLGESDTEVALAAWAAWGRAALPRFVGMYALAVLDLEARRLTLARDPFGIKPLYLARAPGALAFASEPQALVEWRGGAPAADPQAVYDFLRYGLTDHGAETLFAGVTQLRPAEWVEVGLDDLALRRGQSWSPRRAVRPRSYAEAQEQVRDAFLRSVGLHLRSDVPVGAALSGGIDSSAIVCAIRELAPEAELHAFTYVPPAGSGVPSEEAWARRVAAHAGATHHLVQPQPGDLARDLDALIRAQGEPFGSLSLYAQAQVFRRARAEGVPVLLDGQGADELFAGYVEFLGPRLGELLAAGRPLAAARFARAARARWGRPARALLREAGRGLSPPGLRRLGRGAGPPWLNRGWAAGQGLRLDPPGSSGAGLHAALERALRLDSLPALLRYEDRSSMAVSVESRVPFLTVELAELCASLPPDHLLDAQGRSKAVLRDALAGRVPAEVLARRDKVGFVAGDRAWLEGAADWVRETLDLAREVPALDAPALAAGWERARHGTWDPAVWRGLNLARWWHLFGVG
ncbi:MAG: asparagine synthase (glutamine-hydrolyzing) [Planctomycetota bacterium]